MPRGSNTDCHGVVEELRHLNRHLEKLIEILLTPLDFSREDRIVRHAIKQIHEAKERLPHPDATNQHKE